MVTAGPLSAGGEHYRRAGEMLLEAKIQVQCGEWTQWIKRNFALSQTSAYAYMKLANATKISRMLKNSTLSDVVQPVRTSRTFAEWHQPVRETVNRVNVDSLLQERQSREKETRLSRFLL